MARVLVTSSAVPPADDTVFAPLLHDGHTIVRSGPDDVNSPAKLIAALRGVAAVLAGVEPYTRAVLDAAPDLRVIARTGVGFDSVDLVAATDRGVAVCTTPNTNQHSVADLAVGMILDCARRLQECDRWTRAGRWVPQPCGIEMRAATVGVVGAGLIGREVIKRIAAFGSRILVTDVIESAEMVERYGACYVPLEALLAESDFVTLHAPMIPETRHLIRAETLALMKPTAYLVNTARGGLVNEADLVEALREGRIAGAALDVFEREPLPLDSPLRDLPNVLLVPHVGGITQQSRAAMTHMAAENAALVLRGEPPLACVNPAALGKLAPAGR